MATVKNVCLGVAAAGVLAGLGTATAAAANADSSAPETAGTTGHSGGTADKPAGSRGERSGRVAAGTTRASSVTARGRGVAAVPRSVTRSVVTTAAQAAQAPVALSPNLLVNPGAEAGDPSLSGYSAVTIPGWKVTGRANVIEYDTPRTIWPIGLSFPMPDFPSFLGFPSAQSGPPDGGRQFFSGGNVATSTLTQVVDLSGAADHIDLGTVPYELGAWLGGYMMSPSQASVKVNFLDENRLFLGSDSIGPVGMLERLLLTGFRERQTSGVLPVGTRSAEVVLDLQKINLITLGIGMSYNNAFADNISFTVGADLPAPPDPTPPDSRVGQLDHVFMVMMENKGYGQIIGSRNAPFLNSLVQAYGFAGNYFGMTHPSLPNYYPLVGGTDFGLTYNCASPCIDATTTLVSNIDDAGLTWRGYAQSMPAPGTVTPSGDYTPDQFPFPAFTSIADDPAYAAAHLFPLEQMALDLASVATTPNYVWYTPNEDFNGEGPVDFPFGVLNFVWGQLMEIIGLPPNGGQYNVPAIDEFLADTVPIVLNSPTWQSTRSALFITFDEDNNNSYLGIGNEGNHIVTVVIPSPLAVAAGMRGGAFTATDQYDHYSLLRTIEESLGLPPLTNNDAYAHPMNEFWT